MSNQQIYLALYRGHRSGSGLKVWLARATDWLTRILTRGQYSHAEIVVREHPQASVYTCYSASIRDKGVRSRRHTSSCSGYGRPPKDRATT